MDKEHYNPYEDKSLRELQPTERPILSDREPFNDVQKHLDIINGYQRNKSLSDYPRRARLWVRIGASILLLAFLAQLVLQFINR